MQYVLKDELREYGWTVKTMCDTGYTLELLHAYGYLIPITVEYDGTPERSRKGDGKRMVYRGTLNRKYSQGIDVFDLVDESVATYSISCRARFGYLAPPDRNPGPVVEGLPSEFVRIPTQRGEIMMPRALYELHKSNGTLHKFVFGQPDDNATEYRGEREIPVPTIDEGDDCGHDDCMFCTSVGNGKEVKMRVEVGTEALQEAITNVTGCSNVTAKLIEQLASRDAKGRVKYGVTLDRNDLSAQDWITHTIEELLDAAGYLTALKRDFDKRDPGPKVPTHEELLAMAPGEYTDWEKRVWTRGFKACVTELIRK